MKLDELIEIADRAYPDGLIKDYYDPEKKGVRDVLVGDGLAYFIVCELCGTYDPEAKDEEQVYVAMNTLCTARDELQKVESALFEALDGIYARKKTNG